ncbi:MULTISPECIES: hydroxymethylglutaryl-CoA synthase family protein [unclassified Okeania]|uniref:hydroxymethylglutaryl-CoA synthase family protein n=1 Tax=unclassified Okeania TaxID=2634635 RepID=UPI0013BCC4CC|nr:MULTISPECIES: hydroxymethylglutaryl-CoA synthase family protein [unclassified Okeania]NET13251.1 hydroxymethylglutaryl-CoA synthase family protein [Okeania sp. SIO1H6]NES76650.1 hydroxymethylglutaryl-CoA synthase family protein [Okeania sp. SIO1H4]NET20281.1 hydroxymethylglutaryl-CoA synthase family protein [Okeania sp. SIO1H5]NET77124.1 hydroxymethylglutaryl-CoA synthase family protein [Okeania sp. SIO1F9]NET94500.1 hydroxymethylglutaryl-CoA synthase family protein [Okeania sp. SIO1H2]
MPKVGIEALNVYGGSAKIDVRMLGQARQLDMTRFDNLMMKEKAVAMPFEDPVSYAINAAKPIIDGLSNLEKQQIKMVITCTESGIDFGKSISTYIQDYLGLSRNCRMFEIKQACYATTAGLQMAFNLILSQTCPGAKTLVIGTDISRFIVTEGGEAINEDWYFAESSSGAGAVAMLVSDVPKIFQADVGCNGYYGYEVMDTCRPNPNSEAGDADLSLLSYLDCCENAYQHYQEQVEGVDYQETFDYLSFHTPFGGMVKGAHRSMMRKFKRAKPADIEEDFQKRVMPGLVYCQQVGNIMGATVFLSLASMIDNADFSKPRRIGIFSYGSGCCSEFYSGVAFPQGKEIQDQQNIGYHLASRYSLNMEEYEQLLNYSSRVAFGTRNVTLDYELFPGVWKQIEGKGRLVLKRIKEFHREYEWV